MQTQQLQWHTEERKVDSLLPHKKTPRKISKEQADRLKQSLETYGLVEIPAVDLDGIILAGHQRIKVLQLLGQGDSFIDVRVPNRKLTDEEAERYMLGSNAIHGEWDFDLLKGFEMDLLVDLGFDQKELDEIWNKSLKEEFDPEKELKKIKIAKTQPGDIIELGKHRLICGDSTKPETLERLFGDERADMIMSDPIYNISIDYNKALVESRRTAERSTIARQIRSTETSSKPAWKRDLQSPNPTPTFSIGLTKRTFGSSRHYIESLASRISVSVCGSKTDRIQLQVWRSINATNPAPTALVASQSSSKV